MTDGPIVRALHHVALRTPDADEAAERWKDLWSLRDAPSEPGLRRLRCNGEAYGIELIAAAEPGHDHTALRAAAADHAGRRRRPSRRPRRSLRPHGRRAALLRSRGLRHRAGRRTRRPPIPDPTSPGRAGTRSPARPPRRSREHARGEREDGLLLLREGARPARLRLDRRRRGLAAHGCLAPRDRDAREVADALPPSRVRAGDFGQMRETLDHVAQRGRWVSWGPGRHAMAQNLFAYVRMPDGGVLRRAVLRHGDPARTTTCRASGRTTCTARTRGAPCRRAPTSASTRSRCASSASS